MRARSTPDRFRGVAAAGAGLGGARRRARRRVVTWVARQRAQRLHVVEAAELPIPDGVEGRHVTAIELLEKRLQRDLPGRCGRQAQIRVEKGNLLGETRTPAELVVTECANAKVVGGTAACALGFRLGAAGKLRIEEVADVFASLTRA